MTDRGEWHALHSAIAKVLQEGRLGRPSFVRAFAQTPGGPQEARAMLHAMTALAAEWFGGDAQLVHALGSEESGHLASLFRWSNGPSALLAVGPAAAGSVRIDLALLGSRGALYYRTAEGVGGPSA